MKKFEVILIRGTNLCMDTVVFKNGIAFVVDDNGKSDNPFEMHSVRDIISVKPAEEKVEIKSLFEAAAKPIIDPPIKKPAPAKKKKK